jgi:hypothetical protein
MLMFLLARNCNAVLGVRDSHTKCDKFCQGLKCYEWLPLDALCIIKCQQANKSELLCDYKIKFAENGITCWEYGQNEGNLAADVATCSACNKL